MKWEEGLEGASFGGAQHQRLRQLLFLGLSLPYPAVPTELNQARMHICNCSAAAGRFATTCESFCFEAVSAFGTGKRCLVAHGHCF